MSTLRGVSLRLWRANMRPATALLAALAVLLLTTLVEAKGGRSRFSSSRSRSSSSRSSTRSSGYRPVTTGCRSCYYSGGHYYHRSYGMYYYGAYYPCTSCSRRAETTEGSDTSLTMDIPAISGTVHAMISTASWNETVMGQGSAEFIRFKDAFTADIVTLSNGEFVCPLSPQRHTRGANDRAAAAQA